MKIQNLLSSFRACVSTYNMINDGDKIAVGLSGGKDSTALLACLSAYRRFSPQKFELIALTLDPGFEGFSEKFSELTKYCESLNVPHTIIKSDIADIVFNIRKEKNPCSLCSKMRRGALNEEALKQGCNKLALGHHADDLVETFYLSFIYEGRLSTFPPIALMDRCGLTFIRPMLFTKESDIIAFTKDLPIVKNPCPVDNKTKREWVRDLIINIEKNAPQAKERMHGAITNPDRYNLFDQYEQSTKDSNNKP